MKELDLTFRGTTSLGSLIDALKECAPGAEVQFDFCYIVPTTLASYRGYYEDLALGWQDKGPTKTVAGLIEQLEGAIGDTYEGWKGGDYTMHRGSSIWVANRGEAGGTAIVGLNDETYHGVILVTKLVD